MASVPVNHRLKVSVNRTTICVATDSPMTTTDKLGVVIYLFLMIKERLSNKAQSLREKKHSLAQEMKAQLMLIKQQQRELEREQLQQKLKKYQAFQESEQAYEALKQQREQRLQRKLSKSHSTQGVPTSYSNMPSTTAFQPKSMSSSAKHLVQSTLSERKRSLPTLAAAALDANPVDKRRLYYAETVKQHHMPTVSLKKQLELKLISEKMNEHKRRRKAFSKVFLGQLS